MIIENVRRIVIKLIVETCFNTYSYFKTLDAIGKTHKKIPFNQNFISSIY